jgi:hypothetical protein
MGGQKRTLDRKCHQMKVKKREKLNGLLAVDASSGEEFRG